MHHFRSPTLAALLIPIFGIASNPILSAADGDSPAVEAHFKALEQEIQDLKKQVAAAKGDATATPAASRRPWPWSGRMPPMAS